MGRRGLLAALVVASGCSFDVAFSCDEDEQCALRSGGACEGDGWCSYPADDCEGGRVYGPYAPPSVAGVCVGAPGETDVGSSSSGGQTSTTTTTSTSGDGSGESSGGSQPACGNGVVEEGESCDDGNADPDDGCHPLCVDPYATVWTREYNAADREDRGFAIDVDTERDAIYVAGLTETAEASNADLLVQRYGLSDGVRTWTFSRDAAGGEDTAEQLEVDAQGDVVVGGVETDAMGVEHAWVAKFDPDGDLVWEVSDPTGSKAEGVAIADDGRIVAVGRVGAEGDSVAWQQWYAPDGTPDGTAILSSVEADFDTRGIDVINVPGVGIQLTGVFYDATPNLWTARFDGAGTLLWEQLVPDASGDVPRGVGQALSPLGGTAMVGTRNTNRFVQFYDDLGAAVGEPWEEGEPGQDEVADIAFLDDGRYVLVGFIGFNLSNTGTADGWIRFNAPDGTLIDERPISGSGGGVDKLLAIENAPYSVVVTGYVKNETTDIDLWLRRYAI